MNLLFTSFFLGLAGFDIAGAVLVLTALAMHCSKKQIYVFAFTSLLSTLLVGLLSSTVLGTSIRYLADLFKDIPDHIYAIIGVFIGFVLFGWFIKRVFFIKNSSNRKKRKRAFLSALSKKGSLFWASCFRCGRYPILPFGPWSPWPRSTTAFSSSRWPLPYGWSQGNCRSIF